MGGFTGNPPSTGDGGNLPEAPDYSAVNQIDWSQMAHAFTKAAPAIGAGVAQGQADKHLGLHDFQEIVAWLLNKTPKDVKTGGNVLVSSVEYLGDFLVGLFTTVLAPLREIFGNLSGAYVSTFAEEMQARGTGSHGEGQGTSVNTAASQAFDDICAPLGFMGGGNPEEAGAGQAAVQKVLGTLIALHLNTWVLDTIANLSGVGWLHLLNSFDDVILAAMNTRSMGRLAFRPFMQTYMVTPLTRDLNRAHPLKQPAPGSLAKAGLRGAITSDTLLDRLAEEGYGATAAEQIIADASKYLPLADVAWLVNMGIWTDQQGADYLTQDGFPPSMAPVALTRARWAALDPIYREIAAECVSQVAEHVMDIETLQMTLEKLDIPNFEIDAYSQLAQLKAHRQKVPTYGQVKAMYLESIVDLDYVQHWLETSQYDSDDVRDLVLLDFTEEAGEQANRALLGARARVQGDTAAADAQKQIAKADQARADHYNALAAKYAAKAKLYGG